MEIEEVIRKVRGGDVTALGDLISWATEELRPWAARRLRDDRLGRNDGVEDVLQDTYLAFLRHVEKSPDRVPDSRDRLLAWFKTCFDRRALDAGRSASRVRPPGVRAVSPEEALDDLLTTGGFSSWLKRDEVADQIALAEDPLERQIQELAMKLDHDRPRLIEEVRALTGVKTLGSAYRLLSEAKEALRQRIERDRRRGEGD